MNPSTRHTRNAPLTSLLAAARRHLDMRHLNMRHLNMRRLVCAVFVAVFCASLFSRTIEAATTCVPRAIGVPGQSAPPNWWNVGASPNAPDRFSNRLDDPRWRGAANYTRGSGTAEQVAFRVLHSNAGAATGLYLSWNVKVVPSLAANADNRLFVGFSPGGGLDDVIISIQLNNAAPGLATSQYGATISTKPAASPGDAYTGGNTPAWLTGRTRIWVQNNPNNSWAVEMMIPFSNQGLAAGLNLSTTFRMWHELRVMPAMGNAYIVYKFPQAAADIGVNGMGNDEYPATNTWEEVRLTNGTADAPDPQCPTDGVSLKGGKIGTTNNPTSQMNLVSQNTFNAKPFNNTGQPIPAGQLEATFYIANWGSQVGLDDSGDPAGLWVKLRNGDKVPSAAVINNAAEGNISFPLTFNAAEKLPFQNGSKTMHQCMLVQLTSTTNLKFLNDSAVRNMDFVNASTFARDAEISVVGLPALGGSPARDVYLYVETANMPARVGQDDRDPAGGGLTATGRAASTTPGNRPGGDITGELDPTMPTYRVHAYHDTGRRVTRNGTAFTILSPQNSFGYYVTHNGALEGWKHSLTGAEQLSPNFYRVAVPHNGAVKVKTTIEAVEPGDNPNPGGGGTGGSIPADADDKRWGLSLHAGASVPHSDFGDVFDPGPNFGVDLEYRLSNQFSLEALYTFHRFRGKDFGIVSVDDINLHQLSGNVKAFGGSGSVRPFLNGGGGLYHFDFGGGGGGGDTRGGVNVGGGLQFNITPTFAVEGSYNFHNVFTPGSDVKFSTLQGGVRFRF
jgi:opacity protein-like surface antigen